MHRKSCTNTADALANHRPTLPQLAALFGVSSRWISYQRSAGTMPEAGATLAECVRAWVKNGGAARG